MADGSSEDTRQKYMIIGLAVFSAGFIMYTFVMVGVLDGAGLWDEATVLGFTAGFAAGIGGLTGSFVLSEVVNRVRA